MAKLLSTYFYSEPSRVFAAALTKLNYNTCIFGDGMPITLKFADAVGEILTAGPIKDVPRCLSATTSELRKTRRLRVASVVPPLIGIKMLCPQDDQ